MSLCSSLGREEEEEEEECDEEEEDAANVSYASLRPPEPLDWGWEASRANSHTGIPGERTSLGNTFSEEHSRCVRRNHAV
ncbi:hypothetical protein GN956_G585 [Arapaima gigas]